MAGESNPNGEVQGRVDRRKSRVESAELEPDGTADKHATRRDTEQVTAVIVLRLVELVLHQRDGGAETRHRVAVRGDGVRAVPTHQLWPGDRHRRGDLDRAEQVRESP